MLTTVAGESRYFTVRTGGAGLPPSRPGLLTSLPGDLGYLRNDPNAVVVDFRNFIRGELEVPVLAQDGSPLAGPNYVAQLYARTLEGFRPVGAPAPFGTGNLAGFWQPGTNSTRAIHVRAGCCADIQVRVWDRSKAPGYETSKPGDRGISRTTFYFATTTKETLSQLALDGYLWVAWIEDFSNPTMMIWSDAILGLDSSRPLRSTNFVAQAFVAPVPSLPYSWDFRDIGPSDLIPVGPVSPVQDGRWSPPPNTVISLPGVSAGQAMAAFLRVWEADKGATYDEAADNGSVIGASFGTRFSTAWSLSEPPVEVGISSFSLSGWRRRVVAPPGLTLLGNPLARGVEPFLTWVLPRAPEGTTVFCFDPYTQSYRTSVFDFGAWTSRRLWLPFGSGFFLLNPSSEPWLCWDKPCS